MTRAHATPLDFTATDSITLNSAVQPTSSPQSGSSVNILDSASSGDVSGLTHVYGDQSANFGSRASGNGAATGDSWNVTGTLMMTDQIVNTTGQTQTYALTFTVNTGNIVAITGGPGDKAEASLFIDIHFGGNEIASSTVDVSSAGGNPATLTTSGFSLGGTFSGNNYVYPDQTLSIVLGELGAGDSATLDYEMLSTATGTIAFNLGPEACEAVNSVVALTGDPWHPHGPALLASATTSGDEPCEDASEARSGDPTDLSNTPFAVAPIATPEPASGVLLGGAVMLFGIFRRRMRRLCRMDQAN
jgi:hypothetical protein